MAFDAADPTPPALRRRRVSVLPALRAGLALLLALVLFVPLQTAQAEDAVPRLPVYRIRPGDTLISIAVRNNIAAADLLAVNPQLDPNLLRAGEAILLPEAAQGADALTLRSVQMGETLQSLSRRYQLTAGELARFNYLTSPLELYLGRNLVLPAVQSRTPTDKILVHQGQSLFEAAVLQGENPWTMAGDNGLASPAAAIPGDLLFVYNGAAAAEVNARSPEFYDMDVHDLPLVQGKTAEVRLLTRQPATLNGSLAGYPLRFFPMGENFYVALQGIYVLAEPGLASLQIQGNLADGTPFGFEQSLPLRAGGYAHETLQVPPETIDPAVTQPEYEHILSVVSQVSPQKYWDGPFVSPAYDPNWITSWFGTRRYYNQDPQVYFHSGVDYGGGVGLPIKAPAPGVVVLTEALTVRGGTTIIDHGWGVFSVYMHQSEIQVKVGDFVTTGQQIGLVGGTGRVTGAHLHWEIWVNGVQVEPLDWLDHSYP